MQVYNRQYSSILLRYPVSSDTGSRDIGLQKERKEK